MQIEIGQGKVDDEPVGVLGNSAVTDFDKTKDALNHMEGVLDPRAHTRLSAVHGLLTFGNAFLAG